VPCPQLTSSAHAETSAKLDPKLRANLQFGLAKGARVINTGHAIQVEWDTEIGLNASVAVVGKLCAHLPMCLRAYALLFADPQLHCLRTQIEIRKTCV
jgi:hypothetical protein